MSPLEKVNKKFLDENESKIKAFGMISKFDDCKTFLDENPELLCKDALWYMQDWCVKLKMNEQTILMVTVAKRYMSLNYILELAKQLDCDPRSCVQEFFTKIQKEETYFDEFQLELFGFRNFIQHIAMEREEMLGPGGLDPVEVMEQLPEEIQQCFRDGNMGQLKKVLSEMTRAEAVKYSNMMTDSGLVPESVTDEEREEMEA